MRLDPQPNDTLKIGKDNFKFTAHPAVPMFAFSQEGRKGIVYQVMRLSDKPLFALKVFKKTFRDAYIVDVAQQMAAYQTLPGMAVCERTVFTKPSRHDLIEKYPELEYAVLMPWVSGETWFDLLFSQSVLSRQQSLLLARHIAHLLSNLEIRDIAHCDIAGANIIIDTAHLRAELIDLEDMYAPNLAPPSGIPAGTDGYQHRTSRTNPQGQWCAQGDRFAGAVILSEILGWHDERIRRAANEEHYFAEDEMQDSTCERYILMCDVLNSLSQNIKELFEQAWSSPTLADCPPLHKWFEAIDDLIYSKKEKTSTPTSYLFASFAQEIRHPTPKSWLDISPAKAADPYHDIKPHPLTREPMTQP